MNAHTPFDANQDWTNPYCQNSSNDPMVDALLGNAYHVVRTVYCNLGNLKLIYDFLNQYGMVLGVQSEAELKALTTKASFARIYDKTPAGDRQVTDYLYVEGDRTGILPDDATATGSWVKVATSGTGGSGGESTSDGGYIPWIYNSGSANGGETTIRIPDETAGAPFMIVNGDWQTEGYDFEYDPLTFEIKFTTPLEQGDFVVVMRTGVPATPDSPNVSDWVTINWLYNQGTAVGGEQVIDIPFTFQSVPAVYKNGLRFYKGLANNSYTIDSDNNRIILTEPLATNDRLIVQLGGEAKVLEIADHTIQEVARSANVKDSEVILSTDTTQVLNGKKVIFSINEQKSYGLPVLPTNVYIQSVANGKLTYNPGSVVVDLLPVPSDIRDSLDEYKVNVNSETGSGLIGTKISLPGTIRRALKDKLEDSISVKDFGAVGDGVADDTAAIQAALDACSNKTKVAIAGRRLNFPGGRYRVTQNLEYTWRASDTTQNDDSTNRVSLLGEGDCNTFILDERVTPGGTALFTFDGGTTDPHLRLSISDLHIKRKNSDKLGWGLLFKNISIMEIRNLTCNWFSASLVFRDCIQVVLDNLQLGANELGMTASRTNWTNPNVFDLRHVMFSANTNGALVINDGANVSLDTCTFEGNGLTKGTGHTIQYDGGTNEGGIGLTVKNCYFENNAVLSDLTIGGSTTEKVSFIIEGNSFQRTSPTRNCTRHITLSQLNPAGLHKVFIRGNTFKFLGGYTHQVGDASVTVQSPYTKVRDEGNIYESAQIPEYGATVARGFDNGIVATAFISAAGPAVSYGHNVASVTRTATGDYLITFKEAAVSGNLVAVANPVGVIALAQVYAVSPTTVRVLTTNTTGTELDTINFNVIVTGINA